MLDASSWHWSTWSRVRVAGAPDPGAMPAHTPRTFHPVAHLKNKWHARGEGYKVIEGRNIDRGLLLEVMVELSIGGYKVMAERNIVGYKVKQERNIGGYKVMA